MDFGVGITETAGHPGLTPRQHEALRFVRGFMTEHGYSPSTDEIKDALRLRSKSNVHRLLGCLEERGAIRRMPKCARSITVLDLWEGPKHKTVHEAIDVAREHLAYVIRSGKSITWALTEILGHPVPTTDLNLAILEIAKAWERLHEEPQDGGK